MDDIDGGAREVGSRGASTPWQPLQLVFKRYIPPNGSDFTGGTLRATAKKKKKSVRSALSFPSFSLFWEGALHLSFHLSNALKQIKPFFILTVCDNIIFPFCKDNSS